MPRGVKKENLPWKLCEVCQRPFTWRKVWERCWDDVKTCSDRCKAERKKQNKAKKEEESNSGSTKETSHDARQMVKMDQGTTAQINSFAGMPLHHQHLLEMGTLHQQQPLAPGELGGHFTGLSVEPDAIATRKMNDFHTAFDSKNEGSTFEGHSMLAPFTSGYQQMEEKPLIIENGEGVYVWDLQGKKYLDALAGLWCTSLGFSEERLMNAAWNQMTKLPFYHSFWNRTSLPPLDLAKELVDIFKPVKMAKVFFCTTGSEANDTQVKLVWYYNNAVGRADKKKIIARQKSYHGSTLSAASLSGLTSLHSGFDLPSSFVLHTDCPHYWRYHLPDESVEEFSSRLADNLERMILKEGPETIAAFIAEPLMGAGGVIPPPATYWDKVQPILKKYDILLIADEVICAFGRLGTMFACEKYNIRPDLVTIAKQLSSGYMPISAVLLGQHIFDALSSFSNEKGTFGHGFTYGGHPVACAVALETLRIYKERDIIGHVNEVAPIFQKGMKKLASCPIIGEIRGEGLVLGIEFVANKETKESFPASWGVGGYFSGQCTTMGMLIRFAGDVAMMSPPLIITVDEIHEILKISAAALKATETYVDGLRS